MAKSQWKYLLSLIVVLGLIFSISASAETKSNSGTQRLGKTAALFEERLSAISNNEFYITNYGIYGHYIKGGNAGWFWPRQSARAYIYGQSMWFGVKRKIAGTEYKLVSVGYNPNSGAGWYVPGSIDDGLNRLDDSDPNSSKYYMYMASDFTPDGKNVKNTKREDWPIRWKNQNKIPGKNGYFGEYISNPAERSLYKPVFISQEDMFCIYKDTDVKANPEYKPNTGYPIGLDIEQTVYSWGFGPYKDFVFFVYNVMNKSGDTLRECYLAPAGDSDIGRAENDRCAFYSRDPSLNLAFEYTETEVGYIGALGMDFLESPRVKTAADAALILAKTGLVRNVGDQIGLTTMRNWVIDNDPPNGPARYDFMSAGVRDIDNGPGDKRFLMATGPFTMAPGDSARTVACILLAPSRGLWNAPPDAQYSPFLDSLIALDKFAQTVYDNNFAAPKPPDPAMISASGIDRGVVVSWDTTSEASVDTLSAGRDFMGYRLYRSRSQSGPWKFLDSTSLAVPPLRHSFIDVGADTTGGLVNNIDYYYWVSSFDEGDVVQGVAPLENTPVPNLNSIRVQPIGPVAGNDIKFPSFNIPVSLGSIRNFRVEATNQARFNQLFSGHPLKVTMVTNNTGAAYTVSINIKDTVGKYEKALTFDPALKVAPAAGDFFSDTTLVGVYRSVELFNCFKIVFDWAFLQRTYPIGFDTAIVTKGNANAAVVRRGTVSAANPKPGFSNVINLGEADINVEFSTGGIDNIVFGTDTVPMQYLKMRIVNATTGEVSKVDTVSTDASSDAAYGTYYVVQYMYRRNGATKTPNTNTNSKNFGNRYYLGRTIPNSTDSALACVYINVNGQQLGIDMSNLRGKTTFVGGSWGNVTPGTIDFAAGDQVTLKYKGGVAGTQGAPPFPLPGAVLMATATQAAPAKYTAELLKQVKVVPNPYIISHIGQITTDVPKLYFNHLPPTCEIRIYNVAGDLIKVISHTNGSSQETWDLLSDGRQKVASQLLIAYIKTPDGADQMVKFSIIVGGFRSIR
jgi:hypothetical protein